MDGTVMVVKGHCGTLDVEGFPVDGEVDAFIIHLEKGEGEPSTPRQFVKSLYDPWYNVRSGPAITFPFIGRFYFGDVTEALEEMEDSAHNIWVRIGYHQWVARVYGSTIYCEYVEEG